MLPKKIKVPKNAYSFALSELAKIRPMKPKASFPMIDTFPHGAPLGGLGAGTFSRSPYGDFNIWHLFPGIHIQENLEHCGLMVWRKTKKKTAVYPLSLKNKFWPGKKLKPAKCVYSALYPRSWYQYKEIGVLVEQFSPVLPHNYRDTSYPVACFRVQLSNKQKTAQEVAVLFSWQNILGWKHDPGTNATEHTFVKKTSARRWNERRENSEFKAIVFKTDSAKNGALNGEMCLATYAPENALVSFCTQYDTQSPAEQVWEPFGAQGVLQESISTEYAQPAGAIAVKATLNPGETLTVPFVLTWDMPFCLNNRIQRYYTRYFDDTGKNSFALAQEALEKQTQYVQDISFWQEKLSRKMPAQISSALFNELYYLADGGSIWDAKTEMFAYLECFDYPFYETLDVRFFGSFPLAKLWPDIEKRIMREFTKTVFIEDNSKIEYHMHAAIAQDVAVEGDFNRKYTQHDLRKRRHALPHDLGMPTEAPFEKINAYTWQNANRWKDLNSKYVLLVYRAYYYSGKTDRDFLQETWPGLVKAIEYLSLLDTDDDGLPENESFPDQTFDNWLMHGTSAYCGILRLAALQAGIHIAELLGKKEQAKQWRLLLKKAKDSLNQKLWNGKYFRFDEKSEVIMSAQLSGQWFLEQLHLPSVLEKEQVRSALKHIYRSNFLQADRGRGGLVNGRGPDGQPVRLPQGDDAWTGVNFAFAGHLLIRGWRRQAERLLNKVIKLLRRGGMLYRTPEAWDSENRYTASMYMRAGVIWALEDWY